MIDEKSLLDDLNAERDVILKNYKECGKNPYFAVELSTIEKAIKIVQNQRKIRTDYIPASLLAEWDSVTEKFRRCQK